MKKLIYTIILSVLSASLAPAQETTVWVYGGKDDEKIIRQRAEIEAKGRSVVVNDEAERVKQLSQRETISGDEKFDRTFREGRELMDKEEWAKAAAKFNEIVCDCPENKQVGAALYWLAYCYKKQNMFKQANETIARLLKNFSGSNWAADARVMQSEINRSSIRAVSVPGQITTTVVPYSPAQSAWVATAPAQVSLEREDEIRLAAFQTLLAADTKRALELMGREILVTESKASETLKREMIRSLRGSRFYAYGVFSAPSPIYPLASSGQQNSSAATAEKQQNLNLMRETLMKGFQTEPSVKVRSEIVYSIANFNDEPSFTYLGQLYSAEGDKDLKKAIINSFGSWTYYSSGVISKEQIAMGTAPTQNTSPVRKLMFDKLLEIFRTERDVELRRLAFGNLQRFSGWAKTEGMIDALRQMYNSEMDEQFKISLINSFGDLTQNQQATNKLLDIAKNDKSDKMRLAAIRALQNNKSPEVIKFLEDLIK